MALKIPIVLTDGELRELLSGDGLSIDGGAVFNADTEIVGGNLCITNDAVPSGMWFFNDTPGSALAFAVGTTSSVLRFDDDDKFVLQSQLRATMDLKTNGDVTTLMTALQEGVIFGDQDTILGNNPTLVIKRAIANVVAGNAHGIIDESTIDRTGTIGYNSYDCDIAINGTDTYDHIAGFQSRPTFDSSGNVARITGFQSFPVFNGGTATRVTSFEARDVTGTGTVTDNVGLYIENLTGGTNNYAIYGLGGDVLFNAGYNDSDFTIRAYSAVGGSIDAYKYDAGLHAHTFDGDVTVSDLAGLADSIPVTDINGKLEDTTATLTASPTGGSMLNLDSYTSDPAVGDRLAGDTWILESGGKAFLKYWNGTTLRAVELT